MCWDVVTNYIPCGQKVKQGNAKGKKTCPAERLGKGQKNGFQFRTKLSTFSWASGIFSTSSLLRICCTGSSYGATQSDMDFRRIDAADMEPSHSEGGTQALSKG